MAESLIPEIATKAAQEFLPGINLPATIPDYGQLSTLDLYNAFVPVFERHFTPEELALREIEQQTARKGTAGNIGVELIIDVLATGGHEQPERPWSQNRQFILTIPQAGEEQAPGRRESLVVEASEYIDEFGYFSPEEQAGEKPASERTSSRDHTISLSHIWYPGVSPLLAAGGVSLEEPRYNPPAGGHNLMAIAFKDQDTAPRLLGLYGVEVLRALGSSDVQLVLQHGTRYVNPHFRD